MTHSHDPLATLLLARGLVKPAELDRAAQLAQEGGLRVETVLSRLGLAKDSDIAAALAEALDLPLLDEADFPLPQQPNGLTLAFLRHSCLLPLHDSGGAIAIAMADPRDDFAANAVRLALGKPVQRMVAPRGAIERALERLLEPNEAATVAASSTIAGSSHADRDRLSDAASGAPAVAFVQRMLSEAVRMGASDIHVEPGDSRLELRFRLDGKLLRRPDPPADLAAAIIGRLKVLAGLDIAEKRLPQDGRARVSVEGREIDIRVATLPAMHGEAIALRLLDRAHLRLDIAQLGFSADIADGLRRLAAKPHGILLVTGPTGSGKTTTLYSLLAQLNKPDAKLLSVEDPVEFRLEGVNQVQVRPAIGLDFARVLRAFLRHDPDIMMVGEIRDAETARIAIQAALTGHLILSTLHTNDALGAIARLLDMGLEPYLLAATLNGVLAQRLVRLLCPDCKQPHATTSEESVLLAAAGLHGDRLYEAKGCPACHGTGYRGRAAIGELLCIEGELPELIAAGADTPTLSEAARRQGLVRLQANGLALAAEGRTSLDEIRRVTAG